MITLVPNLPNCSLLQDFHPESETAGPGCDSLFESFGKGINRPILWENEIQLNLKMTIE
jgi:hypothetical protein